MRSAQLVPCQSCRRRPDLSQKVCEYASGLVHLRQSLLVGLKQARGTVEGQAPCLLPSLYASCRHVPDSSRQESHDRPAREHAQEVHAADQNRHRQVHAFNRQGLVQVVDRHEVMVYDGKGRYQRGQHYKNEKPEPAPMAPSSKHAAR